MLNNSIILYILFIIIFIIYIIIQNLCLIITSSGKMNNLQAYFGGSGGGSGSGSGSGDNKPCNLKNFFTESRLTPPLADVGFNVQQRISEKYRKLNYESEEYYNNQDFTYNDYLITKDDQEQFIISPEEQTYLHKEYESHVEHAFPKFQINSDIPQKFSTSGKSILQINNLIKKEIIKGENKHWTILVDHIKIPLSKKYNFPHIHSPDLAHIKKII